MDLSKAEAEYVALSAAVQEGLRINQLLADVSVNIETPMTIYEDNQAAISMSKNPQFHERTKHIDIKYQFVRDQSDNGTCIGRYPEIQQSTSLSFDAL